MQLRPLISNLPHATIVGTIDREVLGLTFEACRVMPGSFYAVMPNSTVSTHERMAEAVSRGASAILCERMPLVFPRTTKIEVPDVREAVAKISAEWHQHPARRMKLIGVTGSTSRTAVAYFLKQLLTGHELTTGLVSSLGVEADDHALPTSERQQNAWGLQESLARIARAGCEVCVVELSPEMVRSKQLVGLEFDVLIFTNLMRRLGADATAVNEYAEERRVMFGALQHQLKSGGRVVNLDDLLGSTFPTTANPEVLVTDGKGESCRVAVSKCEADGFGMRLSITAGRSAFECAPPLVGWDNLYHFLAAVGVASLLGVKPARMRSMARQLRAAPGQLELVKTNRPVPVFVDGARTPTALHRALTTIRQVTPGRVLVVIGSPGGREIVERSLLGQVAAQWADFTVITSDNPRQESPAWIAAQIQHGFRKVRDGAMRIELDRREAITNAVRFAQAGDAVLVAGKGHETWQESEGTVVPFDDRVYIRAALAEAMRPRPEFQRVVNTPALVCA